MVIFFYKQYNTLRVEIEWSFRLKTKIKTTQGVHDYWMGTNVCKLLNLH